jgi:general nucleoside transport system permease protein
MLAWLVEFIAADMRTMTPILLAALGMIFSERSGSINIGAEGIMLMGALAAAAGSFFLGNVWAGALVAMFTGMLMALVFAYLTVSLYADQIVVGAGLNVLGLGLSTSIARVIFGLNATPPKIDAYDLVPVPILEKIPYLGDAFFNQKLPVYIALLLVPLVHFILFKTDIGLKIRAAGEHPKACDTLGINVQRVRYGTLMVSGLFLGFAGSYVSLGLLSFFTENMISGRGFIALAAVVFGKWKPKGLLLAALLFGAGDALQFRLQASGTTVPYQFLLMVPYILTIAALVGLVGKSKGPAARGKPYVK